jgi:threonylcarbamoyladenosine tRNA methylthiotransferase MtaB
METQLIKPISNPHYKIYTFGCKVNTYDSGLMEKNLQRWGFNDQWINRRVHILNTCAVTAEATKEAVKSIRRLKAKDPFCTVVVTGCSAQVDTSVYENLQGADLVVANSHKNFLPEIIEKYFKGEISEKIFKSNIFRKEDLEAGGGEESHHTRAFLKIQDGCNSFCSYCIIPYARGKSRSIPVDVLVSRIKDLEKNGYNEVVLTGVHIGDYSDSKVENQSQRELVLEDLLESILERTQISRIRLTSLEPVELTKRLLSLYANSRLCPHFHMSIQSAEDQVLKEMKRQYNAEAVRESLELIRTHLPQAYVGMDVIVGFPNETDDRFQKTYELLATTPWTRLHVFPYSERTGTRAAQMTDTVMPRERQRRSELLRELSWNRLQEQAAFQVGTTKEVLVLKRQTDGLLHGLSRDYWPVLISGNAEIEAGQEVLVRVNHWERPSLSNFDVRLKGEVSGGQLG